MAKYEYNEKIHKNPAAAYNLDAFYFIVHEKQLLVFPKKGGASC